MSAETLSMGRRFVDMLRPFRFGGVAFVVLLGSGADRFSGEASTKSAGGVAAAPAMESLLGVSAMRLHVSGRAALSPRADDMSVSSLLQAAFFWAA